jgi:hypothetical protein
MLSASLMGATAFQKGLGGVHALAHPIGAVFDTHHGLANAILLPYVLVRNREAIAERLDAAGRYIGLPESGFDGFLSWVLALRKELNISHTLAEINIPLDQAEAIGAMAKNDPSDGGNPINLTPDDYAAIYRAAVTGTL